MADDVYDALREFLDKFPRGFVKTETGVEIRILKRLFTEAEAELATKLKLLPESLETISERLGVDAGELKETLDAMATKGLIFRIRRKGTSYYRAAPFMIGFYEYSIKRIDRELAEMFKEYYEQGYIKGLGSHNIPGFKVIPIEETASDEKVLLPYQKLEESIRNARRISVTDCMCRVESNLLDEGCNHPVENCLSFGAAAEYYIDSGLGREIKADEALKILKEADESGLIHASVNSVHLSNICNCCPCCCAALKALTQKGSYRQRHFNAVFEAVVDDEACTICEICLDRCPVDAIAIYETTEIDRDLCLGCGLCATTCDMEAIRLVPREDLIEPFDSVLDLWNGILKSKGLDPLKPE